MSTKGTHRQCQSAVDTVEEAAMAFQAPAWTQVARCGRDVRCGLRYDGGDRAARAGPGCRARPCPESGTSCGTDRQRSVCVHRERKVNGMNSLSVWTAKPECRDPTPEEGQRFKLLSSDGLGGGLVQSAKERYEWAVLASSDGQMDCACRVRRSVQAFATESREMEAVVLQACCRQQDGSSGWGR